MVKQSAASDGPDVVEPLVSGDPSQDPRGFRQALGLFATGVTIITAATESRKVGVTANSFSSLSLDPPMVLWCISKTSTSLDTFSAATHFAINVLAQGQTDLSNRFARTSADKYEGVSWAPGRGGAPLLAGAVARFECKRLCQHEGGDHLIFVGLVERYESYALEPLLFVSGRYSRALLLAASNGSSSGNTDGNQDDTPLLQLLWKASAALSERFESFRSAEGLNLNQSRILTVLDRAGTPIPLARVLRGTLLGQDEAEDGLSFLSSRGLAVVTANGECQATAKGHEVRKRLRAQLAGVEADIMSKMPGVEPVGLRRMISSLAKVAKDQTA